MKVCPACETRFSASDWTCPACGHVPPEISGVPSFAPELSAVTSGFDPAYFETLFRLEDGNFWFQARNRLILWAMHKYFPDCKRFLEVGCGTGFVLAAVSRAFPGLAPTGSELHAEGLAWTARRLPRADFVQMDARRIPYDCEFDLVGAFDVIEHIDEDEQVLAQARQALRPRGGLLLTVPQHRFLWSASDDYAYHKRRYSRGELLAKVKRAGFAVKCCTSFVTMLLPALMASRLRIRSSRDFDPEAEFRLSPLMNQVLAAVMSAERALIRSGVRLPAGGSLLLAAERT